MRLSTLPMLVGLAAGTVTWSAQSTQVTKSAVIQTIQPLDQTNLDRDEVEKQAIIDSLQKLYGPFVIYDSSNPDDVKKLEKMEKEAEKKQIKAYKKNPSSNKIDPRIPSGNRVRRLDRHEADKYARDTGAHIAFEDVRGINEIITYKRWKDAVDLSVLWTMYDMNEIVVWSQGLELILTSKWKSDIWRARWMNANISAYISNPKATSLSAYISKEEAAYYLKKSDFLGFLSTILAKDISAITPKDIYILVFSWLHKENIEKCRK